MTKFEGSETYDEALVNVEKSIQIAIEQHQQNSVLKLAVSVKLIDEIKSPIKQTNHQNKNGRSFASIFRYYNATSR